MLTKDKDNQEYLRIQRIESAYLKYGTILISEIQRHYFSEKQIAEDIVQTTFERVIKYGYDFAKYNDEDAFRFLYSVMKHESYNLKKKLTKDFPVEDIDQIIDNLYYTTIEADADPEFLYTERTIVREAMKKLPEDYSTILYLHYYYGYKFKEIAAFLGISENTAIQKCHYIRKKLKAILVKEGFQDASE